MIFPTGFCALAAGLRAGERGPIGLNPDAESVDVSYAGIAENRRREA
jgi:hypothetical protein